MLKSILDKFSNYHNYCMFNKYDNSEYIVSEFLGWRSSVINPATSFLYIVFSFFLNIVKKIKSVNFVLNCYIIIVACKIKISLLKILLIIHIYYMSIKLKAYRIQYN